VLRKVSAYIRILRPLNFLFVIVAVIFGAFYKYSIPFPILLPLVGAFAAAFISGGGYVLNDYFDYSIDVINRQDRVLPSGLMSKDVARIYGYMLIVLGVFLTLFLRNVWATIIAVINSFLLMLYAMKSKHIHFWKNLLVATITASTFLFGSVITENLNNALLVIICAFFYTLIREIVKDVSDKYGDRALLSKTLPQIWGNRKTILLAFLFWAGFVVTIIWGYPEFYSSVFFIIILTFFCLVIGINLLIIYVKPTVRIAAISHRFMKLHMLLFLIILWMAQ